MTTRLELAVAPEGMAALAEALRPLAGRVVRWELDAGEGRREIVGRVARPAEFLSATDPHLLVAPGQTNATNVLAFIAVHLRWRGADRGRIQPLFARLGWGRIAERIPRWAEADTA